MYKFVAADSNSSHCSTCILSNHITSALTAVKDRVFNYCETAFSNGNVDFFKSIENMGKSSKNSNSV